MHAHARSGRAKRAPLLVLYIAIMLSIIILYLAHTFYSTRITWLLSVMKMLKAVKRKCGSKRALPTCTAFLGYYNNNLTLKLKLRLLTVDI